MARIEVQIRATLSSSYLMNEEAVMKQQWRELFELKATLEHLATGRVTAKVDVYAFGVVLMELITGRKAVDDTMPDERSHLVTWFCQILINKENIMNTIDQTLNPDEETMENIIKVVELAKYCTTREQYQRPDMGHVVNILSPLVKQWKPTYHEEEHSHSTFHGEEDTYGIDPHMSLSLTLER
uniref:Serine-threonine/tyrosine-protein kinase catalytic domain-containing protein n=1 Tax=Fagus sylvatica TaxID=28930 RepID=A0A2N9FAY2_FAGSY